MTVENWEILRQDRFLWKYLFSIIDSQNANWFSAVCRDYPLTSACLVVMRAADGLMWAGLLFVHARARSWCWCWSLSELHLQWAALESRSSSHSHCLHVHERQRIQIPEKSVVFWGWRWAVLERGERRSGRTSPEIRPDGPRLFRILPLQHVSVQTLQTHTHSHTHEENTVKWHITRRKDRINHFNNMKSLRNDISVHFFE